MSDAYKNSVGQTDWQIDNFKIDSPNNISSFHYFQTQYQNGYIIYIRRNAFSRSYRNVIVLDKC